MNDERETETETNDEHETVEHETETTASSPTLEPPPPAPDPRKTIETWRDELGTPAWLWAGMKVGMGWPIGKEVTRAEYDAAVKWAANVPCR